MGFCKLISTTQDPNGVLSPEELITFAARVSNPGNQMNVETAPKLLGYLIKHGHWSPFEMVSMTVEIQTTRSIAPQILRHRSFSFQEFSQRYAEVKGNSFMMYKARRQDAKNRQNSLDDLDSNTLEWFYKAQEENWDRAHDLYNEALQRGIAKECARVLLTGNAKTVLYMSGTVRSWIHYLLVRTKEGVQPEHKDLAVEIRDDIFSPTFSSTAEALEWRKPCA